MVQDVGRLCVAFCSFCPVFQLKLVDTFTQLLWLEVTGDGDLVGGVRVVLTVGQGVLRQSSSVSPSVSLISLVDLI